MAFTEFYCQNGGSNLNAGSDNNNAAKYAATNGNWSLVTQVYTPTDGSNPVAAGVAVGDYASVYIDGATVGVVSARITAVTNAVNGPITLSTVSRAGQAPTTSVTARSIRVGGAWKGMGGTVAFPFSMVNLGTLKNVAGDLVRILIKNDQVYSMGAVQITVAATEPAFIKGYAVTADDDGIASLVQTSGGSILWSHQSDTSGIVKNLEFSSTVTSGSPTLVSGGTSHTYDRCIFHGSRASAVTNGARMIMIECEFYDNNKVNSANAGCVECDIDAKFIRCVFRDCLAGSNANGLIFGTTGRCIPTVENCIFKNLSGSGILATGASGNPQGLCVQHSDFYNIGVSGIRFVTGAAPTLIVENSNFLKCAQYGIDASAISGGQFFLGKLANNGYGSGTMANVLGDTAGLGATQEINKIVYASNATPWLDPDNVKFDLVLGAAISVGRGAFTITAPNGPTISYEDIGAASADATPFGGWGGDALLPAGYVGFPFLYEAFFFVPLTATVIGTLPPGLTLDQPTSTSYEITGTPTTVGTYIFTIRHSRGPNHNDVLFEIPVLPADAAGTSIKVKGGTTELIHQVTVADLARTQKRAEKAISLVRNFRIVGPGVAGDIEKGFSVNP